MTLCGIFFSIRIEFWEIAVAYTLSSYPDGTFERNNIPLQKASLAYICVSGAQILFDSTKITKSTYRNTDYCSIKFKALFDDSEGPSV
jgi:hypothetical protein